MRRSLALLFPALLLLAACEGGWFGAKEAPPLPGERLPVLVYDQQLQAGPTLKTAAAEIYPARAQYHWLSAGCADHGGGSYTLLSTTPKEAWSADIGDGTSADNPLIPTPVITGGVCLYSLDSGSTVRAFSAENGKKLGIWMWPRPASAAMPLAAA